MKKNRKIQPDLKQKLSAKSSAQKKKRNWIYINLQ